MLAPALPFIVAGLHHDATVSVLRAYSERQCAIIQFDGAPPPAPPTPLALSGILVLPRRSWRNDCTLVRRLREMLQSVAGGDAYEIVTYDSASFADWIGIPPIATGLSDPVVRFYLMMPNATYQGLKHLEPLERGTTYLGEPDAAAEEGRPFLQLLLLGLALSAAYYPISLYRQRKARQLAFAMREGEGQPAILAIATANPPNCWDMDTSMVRNPCRPRGRVTSARAPREYCD